MSTEQPPAEARWDVDPTGRWELRWWDGERWTDDVRRGETVGRDAFVAGNYVHPSEAPKRNKAVLVLAPLAACLGIAVLLLIIALVAGDTTETPDASGSGERNATSSTTTESVPTSTTSTTTTSTTAPTTTTEIPTTTTPPTTAATVPPATSPPPTEAPATAVMPNVVCRNLQDAQDDIQRTGVFFSGSEDATGQGRSQVIDSNWIVVRQTPAPGALFKENEAILYVVRTSEPNDC